MKKFMLFLSLIVCCAMAAVAQEADIVIKGKIDGIKKGRLYMLARSSEESTDTLGSCDFKKGKFELKAVADESAAAFCRSQTGKNAQVIFERSENGRLRGWSDNYIPFSVPEGMFETGRIVNFTAEERFIEKNAPAE